MPTSTKSPEDMLREMYTALTDPDMRPSSAKEVRQLRETIQSVDRAAQTRHEAHEQKDDDRHKQVIETFKGVNSRLSVVETAVARRSAISGQMTAVSPSVVPPGKPSETGTWKVSQGWVNDIEQTVETLKAQAHEAERNRELAEAARQGAEDARKEQAKAAEEARVIAERVNKRKTGNLKIALAILALLLPTLTWVIQEGRHPAPNAATAPR
jgi:hypothetical protein